MSILSLIASNNFIAVNKGLIKAFGLHGAVLLGELAGRAASFESEDGFFYATIESIQENTSLSRYQQDLELAKLEKVGAIESKVAGMPARRYFRINEERILQALGKEADPSDAVCGKPANKFAENQQTSLRETDKLVCEKPANYARAYSINNKNKNKNNCGVRAREDAARIHNTNPPTTTPLTDKKAEEETPFPPPTNEPPPAIDAGYPKTPEEVINRALVTGVVVTREAAERFLDYYQATDWINGRGVRIIRWIPALKEWIRNRERFDKLDAARMPSEAERKLREHKATAELQQRGIGINDKFGDCPTMGGLEIIPQPWMKNNQ